MAIAQRLGIHPNKVEQLDLVVGTRIREPKDLLAAAFKAGPVAPKKASILLGTAILAQAERTAEGRLAAALALLAPLVAQADARKTLGPEGATIRMDIMPNGWEHTLTSWGRLRYAWREGMGKLLDERKEHRFVYSALDELTRMSPAEPEPITVSITEKWPTGPAGTLLTLGGGLLTVIGLWKLGAGKKL